MTARRVRLAVACTTALCAPMAIAAQVAAQEAPAVEVGWWTRNPAQSAPEGGFAVASAPDGPMTVAAMTISTGGEVLGGTITAEETGGLGQAVSSIVVCPASGPVLLPEEPGGAFDDAPEPDCERDSVPFERDAETLLWSADVTALVADGSGLGALMLVPEASDAPLQPGFDVRFSAPQAELLFAAAPDGVGSESDPDTRSFADGDSDPGTSSEPSDPAPETDRAASGPSFDDPAARSSGRSFADEPNAASDETTEAPPSDDAAIADTDIGSEDIAAPLVRPTSGISAGDRPDAGTAITYVVLAALAGAMVTGFSRFTRTHSRA